MVPRSEFTLLQLARCKGMFPYCKPSPHFTSVWSKSRGNAFSAPRLHGFWKSLDPGPYPHRLHWPLGSGIPRHNMLVLLQPTDERRTRMSIARLSSSGCRARRQSEASIERKQFSEPCLPPSHCHTSLPQQKKWELLLHQRLPETLVIHHHGAQFLDKRSL